MLRAIALLVLIALPGAAHAQERYEWIRQDPSKPGLLIFIHGIIGGANTFSSADGKRKWPELVRDDPLFQDMNILRYDYASALMGPGFTSRGLAARFRNDLNNELKVAQYDRIVIVGHSLGGIIARQYVLAEAAEGENGNLRKIKALFLYGTPMGGSALANILGEWGSSPLLQDLRKTNANGRANFLKAIRTEWTQKKLGLQVPSYCAYETKKYKPFFVFGVRVVDPDSAELLCNADIAETEEDHVSIVKPENPANFYSHTLLSKWYKEVFPAAARLEQPSNAPVVIADCGNDTYGPDFHAAVSNDIFALTGRQPRSTRKLPRDWRAAYRPLLWDGATPRVIVIHLSCFANGSRTNEARLNQERTEDFVRFLQTVEPDGIRVLVYSLAFADGDDFLTQYAVADRLKKSGRLVTFRTSHGKAFTEDPQKRKQLKDLVSNLLAGAPPQPAEVSCECDRASPR